MLTVILVINEFDCMDGVFVFVDCGVKPRPGQTKGYQFGACWLFAKHTALSSNSKYWLYLKSGYCVRESDMSNVTVVEVI